MMFIAWVLYPFGIVLYCVQVCMKLYHFDKSESYFIYKTNKEEEHEKKQFYFTSCVKDR